MKSLSEVILKRIGELSAEASHNTSYGVGSAYAGVVNLASLLYGKNSPVSEAIKEIWNHAKTTHEPGVTPEYRGYYDDLSNQLRGVLNCMKKDVDSGLIATLETRLQAEVFASFVSSAKAALDEGRKDVAAVLASAAFEDAIKRYADHRGLPSSEDGLQSTINLLKSKGLIGGAQKGVIDSFVRIRNTAMHADWEKIHSEDVRGLIGFTEEFLLTKFERPT